MVGYRCLQKKTGFLNCVLSKQKDVGEAKGGKLVSLSLSPHSKVFVSACVLHAGMCMFTCGIQRSTSDVLFFRSHPPGLGSAAS